METKKMKQQIQKIKEAVAGLFVRKTQMAMSGRLEIRRDQPSQERSLKITQRTSIERTMETINDGHLNRYRGALFGMAVGDALGAPIEGVNGEIFKLEITEMIDSERHGIPKGHWTDDTSMALCLAKSLIEKNGYDPVDQMTRWFKWMTEGYMSSTGACFGIGKTTRLVLTKFGVTGEIEGLDSAANGAAMRLLPIPLAYRNSPIRTVELARHNCKMTHNNIIAMEASEWLAYAVNLGIRSPYRSGLTPKEGLLLSFDRNFSSPEIRELFNKFVLDEEMSIVNPSGYIVETLAAVLSAFKRHPSDFEAGMTYIVNLGGDADTTGAIYGYIAGAYLGYDAIPQRWVEPIAMKNVIEDCALGLLEFSTISTSI